MQYFRRFICVLCVFSGLSALAQGFEDGAVIKSQDANFKLEYVISAGSPLKQPWSMAFLPDGSFLVADKVGDLYLYESGALNEEPIKGLPKILVTGQGGLLDLELHPQFEQNGWIYISFSKEGRLSKRGGMTALVRAKLDRDQMRLTELETIYEIKDPDHFSRGGRHWGTRTVFDEEGYLYIAIGDRGQQDKAQDLGLPHGSIFRLNDDGSIPQDNPFVGQSGVYEGIWSYGHRNPQGMAFHPETGELFSIEHGPKGGDELNWVRKGRNYGWPEITYGVNYSGTKITDRTEAPGMEQPVKYWVPSPAPCGMAIYSGDTIPAWKNNFFIANLRHEKLIRLAIDEDLKVVQEEDLLEGIGRLRDVETGPEGNLWVLAERPGRIIKIVPAE
ncbi:MAG: PQQ-dependent sugar dehydrogenase [Opitutales bacterium]